MCSDDLAALHQAGKSEREGDTDTPGMELNLRVCSCTGLQELLYLDRLSMTNERDGEIIRSQSFFRSLPLTLSPSLCLSRFVTISFSVPLFSPFSYP